MYVDFDRGFGVVGFHFDPADYEEVVKDHKGSNAELLVKLLSKSEVVAGEAITKPGGAVRGAANIMRVCYEIGLVVVESLQRHGGIVPQNVLDHRGRAGDVVFKKDAVAASGASCCSAFGQGGL